MSENKQSDTFSSVEELVEFFDNNDTGDYLSAMPEAQFDVSRARAKARLRKHNLIAVDEAIMQKVAARAEAEQTTPQALINAWLAEKFMQTA